MTLGPPCKEYILETVPLGGTTNMAQRAARETQLNLQRQILKPLGGTKCVVRRVQRQKHSGTQGVLHTQTETETETETDTLTLTLILTLAITLTVALILTLTHCE